ncbi:MAG: hypothetical protein AAF998_25795 [Bacteroidota bacterium]
MAIDNYTPIPGTATAAGAPIDSFLLRSLRTNNDTLELYMRAALATGFGPMGGFFPSAADDTVEITSVSQAEQSYLFNARSIDLQVSMATLPRVPLIWFAKESIVLQDTLDASGNGAQNGEVGNFGGSGGGDGTTASGACEIPLTRVQTAAPSGTGSTGDDLAEHWASRIFMHLAGATGGGPGAGANGGAGGGIIILCAPRITTNGNDILANGANGGAGDSGGGGGGLVLLIGHQIDAPNISVSGGTGSGAGAAGGNGYSRIMRFN